VLCFINGHYNIMFYNNWRHHGDKKLNVSHINCSVLLI